MILKHLNILNYKNIAEALLDFSPKINCFIGNNGEGKTNILDAVYFLSFTKSATNTVDSMNVKHGESSMMLQGIYDMAGVDETISCGLKLGQKKIFRRGGKAYKRMVDHIGLIPLIMVSPSDSCLVIGGSEERRNFMDAAIAQYNPSHLHNLSVYNRALQQRNVLLRRAEEQMPSIEMLQTYEEIMASSGEALFQERTRFIEEFTPVFQVYYSRLSGGNEDVMLTYESHCQRGPLLEVIQRDRNKDLAVGYSLHGAHRDDLNLLLGGYSLRREGSQGQSKTFLLSLKFAEYEFLCRRNPHSKPILLLDDIFDKLDANRVENIVALVAQPHFGQIFITDTDRLHLAGILQASGGEHRIFTVRSGVIE